MCYMYKISYNFITEETDMGRLSDLPKVTQQVSDAARIQMFKPRHSASGDSDLVTTLLLLYGMTRCCCDSRLLLKI